jgi:hypothetical protein
VTLATTSRFSHYVRAPFAGAMPAAIGLIVFAALLIGWLRRDEEYLTPDHGLGYWLGICGSLMMLLLLMYSVRKRKKSMRSIGSIPTWFRIHMLLGVAGPVLIMFHSNFRLGALNSNVALFAMLTVAGSGVIGRYIYRKIHMGMYGRKAVAKDILSDAEMLRRDLAQEIGEVDYIFKELSAFGKRVIDQPPSTALSSLLTGGALALQAPFLRARLLAEVRSVARRQGKARGWSLRERRSRIARVDEVVKLYFNALLKAAELRFYERLFSLWHLLHLPLFFLMIMTVLVHVWAAHRY